MERATLLAAGAGAFAVADLAGAEAAYRAILEHRPADAEALSNLAATLNCAQRHDSAEAASRAALGAQPGYWPALANLGNALHRQQRHHEAVNAYHATLEINPRHAATWTNLGVALNEMQRMADSLIAHNAAASLAPGDPQIRTNRAMALLMNGDYASGFAEFEWRWRSSAMAPHGFIAPQWRGEDPAGKTILLHAEGGFGDTIQFIRYAPLLAARGARVIARVQAPLLSLLRRSFPTVSFTAGVVPPHDLHCPLLSLPFAFGTTISTIPAQTPYLAPNPEKTCAWREKIAGAGLTVGLVWAGAPLLGVAERRAMNANRSLPLAALAPLAAMPGCRFVSLQIGAAADPTPPGLTLLDPTAQIADFDDTAAIAANLDVIVTIDSAVAHLAGALGRPVHMLSRYDACWRWLAGRTDSPWYPGMHIHRQQSPGDWRGPVGEIALALAARKEAVLF